MQLDTIVVNVHPLHTPDELIALVKLTEVKVMLTFDMYLQNIVEVTKKVDIPICIGTSIFDYAGGEFSTSESLKLEKGWYHFAELLNGCENTNVPKSENLLKKYNERSIFLDSILRV